MIKSSFTYTKKELGNFINVVLRKNKSLTLIYILSAIIIACSVFLLVTADYLQGSLFLACGIFFAFYGLILKAIGDKNNRKNIDNVDKYEFDEDKLTATSFNANGEMIATMIVKYCDVFKLMQNGDRAYIFVNKVVALIIAKENFANEGEYFDVINRIKMQMPKKA